jgi:hypothetical protein
MAAMYAALVTAMLLVGLVAAELAYALDPDDGLCVVIEQNPDSMTVQCTWVDQPGDDHYVELADVDGVAYALNESGDTVELEYGSYQWQTWNLRFGVRFEKNPGTLSGVPPATTTTSVGSPPESSPPTSGTPSTFTSTPGTFPEGGDTTTTTLTRSSLPPSSTIPPVTTPDGSAPPTLPFTGPTDDLAGWAVVAVVGLSIGGAMTLLGRET